MTGEIALLQRQCRSQDAPPLRRTSAVTALPLMEDSDGAVLCMACVPKNCKLLLIRNTCKTFVHCIIIYLVYYCGPCFNVVIFLDVALQLELHKTIFCKITLNFPLSVQQSIEQLSK